VTADHTDIVLHLVLDRAVREKLFGIGREIGIGTP
jgi:hypothetical protein